MRTAGSGDVGSERETTGQRPPRHLIVTLYGLHSRAGGGWMSVASLVRLLADLGADESAVRSAVSRLKRRGILEPSTVSGAAGYTLSDEAQRMLRQGDRRIFSPRRATLDEGWLLVAFSVPESERSRRHMLRTQLARLGFGTASPGVWIAPAQVHDEVEDVLARLGLREYADLFRADYLSSVADLPVKARQWWDIERVQALCSGFLLEHRPTAARWAGAGGSDTEAFVDHTCLVTDWRRLVYLDPGLPRELLPAKWSGSEASVLFRELHERLEGPARRHVNRVRSS